MKVVCNNQWRDIISWYDLTEKEKKDLDHNDFYYETQVYFRYRNQVYSFNEFLKWDGAEYDGVLSMSYFNGLFIKINNEMDKVKVYRYVS